MIDSNIESLFEKVRSKARKPNLPMKDIAQVIAASIDKNFRVGGRYNPAARPDDLLGGGNARWKDYSSSTKGKYKKRGWTTRVTLSRTAGGLRQSIAVQTAGYRVDIAANKKYARVHQLGDDIKHPGGTPYMVTDKGVRFMRKDGEYPAGTKMTKPHTIPMPSRPYIVIQAEDLEDILDLIAGNPLE